MNRRRHLPCHREHNEHSSLRFPNKDFAEPLRLAQSEFSSLGPSADVLGGLGLRREPLASLGQADVDGSGKVDAGELAQADVGS